MKRLFFLLLVVSIVLISCEEPITFSEPQPMNVSSLEKFPNRIQGKFLSKDDSSFLNISKVYVVRVYDFLDKISTNEIDSSVIRKGDTLIDISTNQIALIVSEDDSLKIKIHIEDTIFKISSDNVLKKYKGHYFLNLKKDENNWEVKKLSYNKGELIISSINSEVEINNLEEITGTSSGDSTEQITFSPSKKQFKEFLKTGGFSENEHFVRVR